MLQGFIGFIKHFSSLIGFIAALVIVINKDMIFLGFLFGIIIVEVPYNLNPDPLNP